MVKVRPEAPRVAVGVSVLKQETEQTQQNNMEIPAIDKIINQLVEHFKDTLHPDEIHELAAELYKAFEEMMELASSKDSIVAKYMPQSPHLNIVSYPNSIVMLDRELRPSSYSALHQYSFKQKYLITVAYSIHQISLAYVN